MSPSTWFRTVALFAGLAILSIIALSSQPDARARDEAKGKKYALLVGVNKYKSSKFAELKYTENDVEKLADLLRDKDTGGFAEVRVLTNTRGKGDAPTAENIRTALKALIKGKGSSDIVLIALSGHGVELEVDDPEKDRAKKGKPKVYGYFCPHDADLADEVSYSTGYSDSLIHIKEILDAMDNCGAGAKLLLMDACRNEMKAEAATRDLDVGKFTIPKDAAALFSCKSGQKAFETTKLEHGVFFHFVLKGLKGEAAKNKRGEVTWATLANYVQEHVTDEVPNIIRDGARQDPHAVSNLSGNSPPLTRAGKVVAKEGKKDGDTKVVKQDDDKFKNSLGMNFVRVQEGTFKMGSPAGEKDRNKDNERQHDVKITKDFYMGVTEVTQGQFQALMKFNPSYFSHDGTKATRKGLDKYDYKYDPAGGAAKLKQDGITDTSDYPVENVSWEDAKDFLDVLNAREKDKKSGWEYVLPTEAQWEYACRGGRFQEELKDKAQLPFHFKTPTDVLTSKLANSGGKDKGSATYFKRTTKVGSYEANRLEIFNMHGNVCEWCRDRYDPDYFPDGGNTDPSGPSQGGSVRVSWVIRGGSWSSDGQHCRAAYRDSGPPGYRHFDLGFRVALVPSSR